MFSRPHLQPAPNPGRRTRGFSLIEAMIAVVVLSTGLLALAALQSALIRSSVDARIRSSAAAAAVSIFEDLRFGSYETLKARADGPAGMATPTYVEVDPAAGNFTITFNTQDWHDNAGVFVSDAVDPFDPATDPPPLGEFTQVDITVAWTDPSGGGTRSVAFSDIIGPLASFNVNRNPTQLGGPLTTQRPIVRTDNPGLTAGVIPIAVGDGRESAATNPKPVIVGNKSEVIETRFNVLTFAPEGELLALIQKRVETSVIACTCQDGGTLGATGSIAATAFRPTFWDGTRYVPPLPTGTTPRVGAASGNNIVQSRLCNDCCRDHHDPTGVAGPKFDPFRSERGDPHLHFKLVDGLLVAANPGDQYLEACRLIRVDGLLRVATDMNDEFFGLLKTKTTLVQSDSPEPALDAADNYRVFVVDALKRRFVDKAPLDQAGLAALYGSKMLNEPTRIDITRDTSDNRWLHARGFYVDHIEQVAQDRIAKASTDCSIQPPTAECVLQFVPFTTINLTELANWRVSDSSILQITNGSGDFGNPLLPIRGKVNAANGAPDDRTADALARIGDSNAGVAIIVAIDPDDDAHFQEDVQPFRIRPAGGGEPPGPSDPFNVTLSGLAQTSDANTTNDPRMKWQIGDSGRDCTVTTDLDPPGIDTDPNPFNCVTDTTLDGVSVDVKIEGYNITKVRSGQDNPCTVSGNPKVDRNFCQNFGVSSVAVNGSTLVSPSITVTADTTQAEVSTITIPSLLVNAAVSVGFVDQGETPATFVCGGSQGKDPIWNPCP